jgi:septum formation protein
VTVTPPRVVLASASAIRRTMLENAGLTVVIDPAAVDEAALKAQLRDGGSTVETAAEGLALAKAAAVSPRQPGALVIGSDQMLDCGGAWLDKPADRAAAEAHLARLAGRVHRLVNGAVVLRDGERLWSTVSVATLTMRSLSAAEIAAYLDAAGPSVLASVGGYQLEKLGAQLFTEVEGDFFTVLGLPLLPLLAFLREQGVPANLVGAR